MRDNIVGVSLSSLEDGNVVSSSLLQFQTMGRVLKCSDSEGYTPSSEPFKFLFVTLVIEQHCVRKLLMKEKRKSAEILERLNAQYGKAILSCESICNWNSKFSEGHEEVTSSHSTNSACSVNICCTEELIMRNR
jgi:hypothetical protein